MQYSRINELKRLEKTFSAHSNNSLNRSGLSANKIHLTKLTKVGETPVK